MVTASTALIERFPTCHVGSTPACGNGIPPSRSSSPRLEFCVPEPDFAVAGYYLAIHSSLIMSLQPFETAEAQGFPAVTQLSVFIDDRVGQLMRLCQLFDQTEVRILGLMVVNSVDCAIVRMILDDPEEGYRVLTDHRFPVKETELVVACLPHGKRGLLGLWAALLSAEINVHYTYALLGLSHGSPTIAIHADNLTMACDALRARNLTVLDQHDLRHY